MNSLSSSQNAQLTQYACEGNLDGVIRAVQDGADVHFHDNLPIVECIVHGHLPILKYFLDNHFDHDEYAFRILTKAVAHGQLHIVQYILEKVSVIELNRCYEYGDYLVAEAAQKGFLNIVKYLISHGAKITQNDNRAIMLSASKGHYHIVEFLLENNAYVDLKSIKGHPTVSGDMVSYIERWLNSKELFVKLNEKLKCGSHTSHKKS